MKKVTIVLTLALASQIAWSETQVTGSVHIGAETTPTKETIVTDFDYLSSGHHYRLEEEDKPVYYDILYGVDMKLRFQQAHSLRLMVDGVFNQGKNMGNRTESVYDKDGNLLSQLRSSLHSPFSILNSQFSILAAYEGAISQQGSLCVSYRYRIDDAQDQLHQQVLEQTAFTRFASNDYLSRSREEEHEVDVHYSYAFPFTGGAHRLTAGGRYNYRQLVQEQLQAWDDVTILNDTFTHRTHYGAIYAGYQFRYKTLTAMGQVEYRYSRMQEHSLHDVLPMARVAWQVRERHTLSAQYGVRLIRPTFIHLNPAHVKGAYTDRNGLETLVGTHVHRVSLGYAFGTSVAQTERPALIKATKSSAPPMRTSSLGTPNVRGEVSLFYLTANDGLTAIWLEKEDIRTYIWGNDGLRHAVGLTPMVNWQPVEELQVHAEATLLWDKRVAAAIHKQNEHVGIAGQLQLTHHLPYGLRWGAHCDYSYGNTLDLYSYAGHGVRAGLMFGADMLRAKQFHLALRYDYVYAPAVHFITPVSYTGATRRLLPNRHEIALLLTYDF
ncbi:MAG: outer membrane beta-barrel family protein [Paludibacteraceae bacterium]|nr:outer membrane beta-barrel family protein [Paludibacteraceae bacterium]